MRRGAIAIAFLAAACAPVRPSNPTPMPAHPLVSREAPRGAGNGRAMAPGFGASPHGAPPAGLARPAGLAFQEVTWPGSGGGALLGVAALGRGRALAVGEPGAVWVDADSNVRVAPFAEGIATAVWADGPDFAIAVGYGGLAWSWNGKSWARETTGVATDLYAVWGRRAGAGHELFAGGAGGTIVHRAPGAASWERMSAPQATSVSTFAGVGDAMWAAGEQSGTGEPPDGALLALGTNGSWVDSCPELACGAAIYGAWSSGPGDLWTAGAAGELVHYSNGVAELVSTGTTSDLTGVWGTGAKDVFIAGDDGTLLRWDGARWTAVAGAGKDLRAIDGLSTGEVWAVGVEGEILHLKPMTAGTTGGG